MKSAALTITIPAEIVCLPDLTLAERVALAHLGNFPACSNGRLARLLGFSTRGIESMLRRLRDRRLITLIAMSIDEERKRAGDCIARADFKGALHHYQLAKQRVEDFPATMLEVRVEALALVVEDETRVLASKLVFEHSAAKRMPGAEMKSLFATIMGLSAERLSQIRPALDAQARLGRPVDISALLKE
jgi:DNA-binding Lrp family transcriptional regulator